MEEFYTCQFCTAKYEHWDTICCEASAKANIEEFSDCLGDYSIDGFRMAQIADLALISIHWYLDRINKNLQID